MASPASTVGHSSLKSRTPTDEAKSPASAQRFTKDFGFLPIPARLRYDPDKPFYFGLLMNASFGFASTFVVANLYYCQPLLSIQLSLSFNVSYNEVSNIPTLIQAGYAAGILLISPLGDLVRRRQLILCLITLSTTLTIGLAVTNSRVAFETLSFLVGMVSVAPQILLPLAADLAPPERRATAISVVLSGLLFGVLWARVLAGVIAEFTTWRVVYYMAIGTQALVVVGSYLMLPDYPSKNDDLTYWDILWTMAKFAFTEPLLIQSSLINIASSACFSNFWVTLTFLLGGPPYNYSTLVIGLFGLVGMFGVAMGPLVGKLIDRLIPWYASLISLFFLVCFQSVQTGAGGINIGAVIISTLGLDIFRQMLQVSLSTAVFGISVAARARLNAIMILSLFIGQVLGTSVGTKVFISHGWRAGAALSMGWYAWQLFILFLRGPHCRRFTWFGYEGGLEARKSVVEARDRELNPDIKASAVAAPGDIELGTEKGQASSIAGKDEPVQHHDGPEDIETKL
ncbi:MFS superfamily [Lyophyllum atratum]|nr:MFS superfamily [Lyophyllum atratum]